METYLGCVQKIENNGTFFNFKPLAKIESGKLNIMSASDIQRLLPNSEYENIMFYYKKDQLEAMDKFFCDDSLIIFESEELLKNLTDNLFPDGLRRPTGYKLKRNTIDFINEGKIRFICNDGIFRVVEKDFVTGFPKNEKVYLNGLSVLPGEKIFIDDGDGFFAGPYEVKSPDTQGIFIQTGLREKKYILEGYRNKDCSITTLEDNSFYAKVCTVNNDADRVFKDFITKEVLLENLLLLWKNDEIVEGLKKDTVNKLVERYKNSVLAGIQSDEIRNNRLNVLKDLLTNESDLDATLESVAVIFFDMLSKFKDRAEVRQWVENIFNEKPALVTKNLQHFSVIQKELEKQNEILAHLRQESETLNANSSAVRSEELKNAEKKIADLEKKLSDSQSECDDLKTKIDLEKNLDDTKNRLEFLKEDIKSAEKKFKDSLEEKGKQMADFVLDGFMANKMLEAAEKWSSENISDRYCNLAEKIKSVETVEKTPEELKDYICKSVRSVRPDYTDDDIMNIAICLTQNFLTVFYGKPGTGKTSVCNIFADVLGLNKIADKIATPEIFSKRYIPVSVEKGWNSKKDFLGYYNPFSKKFDSGNRQIFDALTLLDIEKQNRIFKMPFLILLDEANLSSPEYYWSEFMNLCDGVNESSFVNLGEDYLFSIPETLRFVATINNDHTTETLSPRLVDRACIISLPETNISKYTGYKISEIEIPKDDIEIISWESLKNAFMPESVEDFSSENISKAYNEVLGCLSERDFCFSPRVDISIRRYIVTAKKFLNGSEYGSLDYAVAQKILPHIRGEGENFGQWLENKLQKVCVTHGLSTSVKIIENIIRRGNSNMYYYDFFF